MPLWYNIPVANCAPASAGAFLFGGTDIPACALFRSAIPKLNSKEIFMSSLSAKDRLSLCSFTFSDGRRCRTPRTGKNPHFCFDHAEKEAKARAAQSLGKDLTYFFSGRYLSACDLSTALGRLIPAVVCGDVKPRTARTVAYLAQTLLQAIHISQHEYYEAFDTNSWRKSIRNSINGNHNYLFPPNAAPEPPTPPAEPHLNCHSERSEESAFSLSSAPSSPPTQPAHATQPAPAPQPAPSPHIPLPPTSAEFVQHVVAGRSSLATQHSPLPQAQQPPLAPTAPPLPACHPERSEGSHPLPAAQSPPTVAPAAPKPAPAVPAFGSGALPLPVRRRLHRA
jgi:hypothetical protein